MSNFASSNSIPFMKKYTLIFGILLLTFSGLKAQDYVVPEETWYHTEVLGSNYHGFVFNKEWDVDIMVENQDGRFTPEDIDIAKAEKLMQKKLAFLNRNHENQEGMCPIIDEHIRIYTRQYVGFTDINGKTCPYFDSDCYFAISPNTKYPDNCISFLNYLLQ